LELESNSKTKGGSISALYMHTSARGSAAFAACAWRNKQTYVCLHPEYNAKRNSSFATAFGTASRLAPA